MNLNTGKGNWQCKISKSYFIPGPTRMGYYSAPSGEVHKVDNEYATWKSPVFVSDASWKRPVKSETAMVDQVFSYEHSRIMQANPLLPMQSDTLKIGEVRRAVGIPMAAFKIGKPLIISIAPNQRVEILIDQKALQNLYPTLKINCKGDASVSIGYAESLVDPKPSLYNEFRGKGNRNQIEGKIFRGLVDTFKIESPFDGTLQTLWWKCACYIQLSFKTGANPIEIFDFYGISSQYPFQKTSSLDLGNDTLKQIEKVGWHTAALCANETYMDCPYYEQMMYVGDTRIQAMVSMYNTNDDRPIKNAIDQIGNSISSVGLTSSRAPTSENEFIPGFSLYWIHMLNDFHRMRNESDFVKDHFQKVPFILDFFERHTSKDHLLQNVPYWKFSDWVNTGGWISGVPPEDAQGHSSILDLQLLGGYQAALNLASQFGSLAQVNDYKRKVNEIAKAIQVFYFDANTGLFSDNTNKKTYSQHAQVLAVLYGIVQGEEAKILMKKTLEDKSLSPCSIYFQYYLNQALVKAGMGDLYLNQLGLYKEALHNGMTTWPEEPEPSRSDCHAWGSSPNIEFFRTVLGVDSDGPGFALVKITPNLGKLKKAECKIPHPKGMIEVKYATTKNGSSAEISLPEGLAGKLVWKGKEFGLKAGKQVIKDL